MKWIQEWKLFIDSCCRPQGVKRIARVVAFKILYFNWVK